MPAKPRIIRRLSLLLSILVALLLVGSSSGSLTGRPLRRSVRRPREAAGRLGFSVTHSPSSATVTGSASTKSGTVTFTVRNTGIAATEGFMTCSVWGAVDSCSPVENDVIVNGNSSANVVITYYYSSRSGPGTVTLDGDANVAHASSTFSVTVNSPIAAVPTGQSDGAAVVAPQPATQYVQQFTVTNSDITTRTYNLIKSCGAWTCTLSRTKMRVTAGQSDTVSITYTSGAIGSSASIVLLATDSAVTAIKDSGWVMASVPRPLAPVVSTAPHNGATRAAGMCGADCLDATASYATPSYTSLDTPRSLTLFYSSGQAHPRPMVQLDVTDVSARPAQKFSLSLMRNGSFVSFTNGSTELFFNQTTPGAKTRLAAQLADTTLPTGAYFYTAIVKSYWTQPPDAGVMMQTSVPVTVLVVNEQGSIYGAGWTVAGVPKLTMVDTAHVVITDGTGGIVLFTRACQTCAFVAPAGDFSTLTERGSVGSDSIKYTRVFPNGDTTAFYSDGRALHVADRFGATTAFGYDTALRLTTITDPAGKTLMLGYTIGKLSSVTDPGGRVSTFTVNSTSGDLTQINDPTGARAFAYTYDANHRLMQTTDRKGSTWKVVYDFASKLASDSTPSVWADSVTGRIGKRYRSLEATMLVDPASGLGSSSSPAAQRLSDSLRAAVFAVTGDSILYAVDRWGAATRIEHPALKDTLVITRDDSGRVTSTIERAKGQTTRSTSNTWSGPRLTIETDNLAGLSVAHAYNVKYNIDTLTTGATARVHRFLNHPADTRVDSVKIGADTATATLYTYDSRGRVTMVRDPKRDTTRTFYAAAGFQNTDSVMQGTRTTRFRYDGYGRVVRTINPHRDSVIVSLDSLNRVRSITAQGGATTTYVYDSLYLRSVTDAKGQVYSYYRNAIGWLDTVTHANTSDPITARRDVYEYAKTGAVKEAINRQGQRTSFTYDPQGRLITRKLSNGRVEKFAYDTAGLWTADSSAEGIDTVQVDPAAHVVRQVTVRNGRRYVVKDSADVRGLLVSRTLADGTDANIVLTTAFGYDTAFRLATIGVGTTSPTRWTNLGYNADGVLTHVHWPTTAAGGDSVLLDVTKVHQPYTITYTHGLNVVFGASYAMDTLDRVQQWTSNDLLHSRTFGYDVHGRLTTYEKDSSWSQETCVRDPTVMDGQRCTTSGGVTALVQVSYTYDSVGNRTDFGATLIAGNRVTAFNGYALTYDSAGHLVHKSKTGFDQYLYWNSLGQLDSVKTNGAVVKYGYDPQGRRVRRTTGTQTLYFIYDGAQVIAEIDSATATWQKLYTYYPGLDRPHGVVQAGKIYYYIQELQGAGNILGLIDTTGAIKNRYSYGPWGVLEDSIEAVANPLRFTGREWDSDVRLYYYRARYYDPVLGRFIAEDPAGLDGGIDPYAYAGDDPVNRTDPTGLWYDDSCVPYTDGSCRQTGGGGSHGATTLGFAGPDLVPSWEDWENIAGVRAGSVGVSGQFYHCPVTSAASAVNCLYAAYESLTTGTPLGEAWIGGPIYLNSLAESGRFFGLYDMIDPCGKLGSTRCGELLATLEQLDSSASATCRMMGAYGRTQFFKGRISYDPTLEASKDASGWTNPIAGTIILGSSAWPSNGGTAADLRDVVAHEVSHALFWSSDIHIPLWPNAYDIGASCR